MCLFIYATGSDLAVDYASEAITFSRGRRHSLFDLLLTNGSDGLVGRFHVVFPHAIPLESNAQGARFADLTDSLVDPSNAHNRFYTGPATLHVARNGRGDAIVSVPRGNGEPLLTGRIPASSRDLRPFSTETYDVTPSAWELLLQPEFYWSVFTMVLEEPIAPKETRWFRFEAATSTEPPNQFGAFETFARRYSGIERHRFDIAGPLNVGRKALATLGDASIDEAPEPLREALKELREQFIHSATSQGTHTRVKAWHLNVFFQHYRLVDEPYSHGALEPVGALANRLAANSPEGWGIEDVYQWKAGEDYRSAGDGMFEVRFLAYEIPALALAMPLISFVLAFVSLVVALWRFN